MIRKSAKFKMFKQIRGALLLLFNRSQSAAKLGDFVSGSANLIALISSVFSCKDFANSSSFSLSKSVIMNIFLFNLFAHFRSNFVCEICPSNLYEICSENSAIFASVRFLISLISSCEFVNFTTENKFCLAREISNKVAANLFVLIMLNLSSVIKIGCIKSSKIIS